MLTRITPIIPVTDPKVAGDWFVRGLGFTAVPHGTGMHLTRDAANIRLVRRTDDMDMSDPRRQQSIYINIVDIDAFWEEHGDVLGAEAEVRSPFDRDYGMREIHVIYESLLIYFGSPIPEAPIQ